MLLRKGWLQVSKKHYTIGLEAPNRDKIWMEKRLKRYCFNILRPTRVSHNKLVFRGIKKRKNTASNWCLSSSENNSFDLYCQLWQKKPKPLVVECFTNLSTTLGMASSNIKPTRNQNRKLFHDIQRPSELTIHSYKVTTINN